jgi:hypothetical protein
MPIQGARESYNDALHLVLLHKLKDGLQINIISFPFDDSKGAS